MDNAYEHAVESMDITYFGSKDLTVRAASSSSFSLESLCSRHMNCEPQFYNIQVVSWYSIESHNVIHF